jgi:hypothetical protein
MAVERRQTERKHENKEESRKCAVESISEKKLHNAYGSESKIISQSSEITVICCHETLQRGPGEKDVIRKSVKISF